MAIRFHCQRCDQLLGIASRKAGAEITCPQCGHVQVVPGEKPAPAVTAADEEYSLVPEADENPPEGELYSDDPAVIEPLEDLLAPETPLPPVPGAGEAGAPSVPAPPDLGVVVPRGRILYHRRTIYLQGALLVILAVVAFSSGYYMGRGDTSFELQIERQKQETASRQRLLLEGKIVYDPGTGVSVGDGGAVIIALPAGKYPEKKLSMQGIRPQDPPPGPNHKSLQMIQELGGVYERADLSGGYSMVLPGEGNYRLLFVSNHAHRATGAEIDEAELAEMQHYFALPQGLIGGYKYRWVAGKIDSAVTHLDCDFRRDEQ